MKLVHCHRNQEADVNRSRANEKSLHLTLFSIAVSTLDLIDQPPAPFLFESSRLRVKQLYLPHA